MDEVAACLRYLSENDFAAQGLGTRAKYNFFWETRQSYGRTALVLSGGGSLGMYHLGVVRELASLNLLPRVLSGACGLPGFALG